MKLYMITATVTAAFQKKKIVIVSWTACSIKQTAMRQCVLYAVVWHISDALA